MAAYAALVSVMQTIEQIEHHPRPPISLDKTQLESLSEKITYLQEFLEDYSLQVGYSKDADPLEMSIADAAYAVEDVIECHIVETIDSQILPQSTTGDVMISSIIDSPILPRSTTRDDKFSFFNFCKCFRGPKKVASENEVEVNPSHENEAATNHPDHENEASTTNLEDEFSPPDSEDGVSPTEQLYQSLQKVIEDMDLLKKEVMEIKEKTGVQHPLLRSTMAAASLRRSSGQNSSMVGFDDHLLEIMDKLTGGRSDLQVIPIVGMGGAEDWSIRVSQLIKLWVGEGFLKPISGKSLEEAANEYLQELINRNLVLAHKLGSIGNVKYCKIHDLLRDLCLRLAEKERFYNVRWQRSPHIPLDTSTHRLVVDLEHTSQRNTLISLQGTSPARSLMWYPEEVPLLRNFPLLRIMSCPLMRGKGFSLVKDKVFPEDMSKIVNLRCLVSKDCSILSSSFHSFWNLQTLFIRHFRGGEPIEIWNMPQLRHLKTSYAFRLADLPSGNISGKNGMVLGNLQTLGKVWGFKCSEDVVKRIPTIKKLRVQYLADEEIFFPDYCVYNFAHLHKLESFFLHQFSVPGVDHLQNLTFPQSLKKLSLIGFHWEDKLEKVGSLPHLEKLELRKGYFIGGNWETVEGQFLSLKFLLIEELINLRYWETESSHFPCLEHLVLERFTELEEIPSEIGEIPTLESIELWSCRGSVNESAKKILEEQEKFCGEVTLQVLVNGIGFAA